jgi:Xaa-Pro dipeptidase
MHPLRLDNLHRHLHDGELDGIIVMPGNNMVYLSGIHTHISERPILLFLFADQPPAMIIPTLEAMKATAAGIVPERIFAWTDVNGYREAFERAAATLQLDGRVLAVEAETMRVLEYDILRDVAPELVLEYADDLLADMRLRKDADEVAALRVAVTVAENAIEALLPQIKIGMTEKDIASKLVLALVDAGADAPAFSPIVSAGPNAASPHATPTDRPIQTGDLLVIDWGAKVGDYASDITRTFAVGDIDATRQAMYAAVKAANAAGVAASQPGASGQDIDRATRKAIDDAGFGDYFIHRTGHGLGMGEHEPPSLMEGNTVPLPVGAVFTVEPGIYLPGKAGVRIEDDVWLSADAGICLTTLPRELRYVG